MSALATQTGRAKAVASLLLAVLVALLYVVYSRFGGGSRERKGAGAIKPSSSPAKQHEAPPALAQPDRSKGPLKGIVPQRIDCFVALVREKFPAISNEEARRVFPRKFEVHGHVVVVRMNPGLAEEEFVPLAQAFAQCFSPIDVDVVLLDTTGIVGELRRPKLDVLYMAPRDKISVLTGGPRAIIKRWKESRAKGLPTCVPEDDLKALLAAYTESPTYAVHVENGVRYGFDVCKVMFCSGNTTERMQFAAVNATGEVVVDMFVGIGYFTLPVAMNGGVAVIHALDKNPDSIAFVRLNAVQNRVDHLIRPQCGDNRVIGGELGGTCDRVLMGLIPTCKEFLPRALFFLKKDAAGRPQGVIHYHYLADKPVARKVALVEVAAELGDEAVSGMTITDLRCVKSYAPKRYHYVADLKFE